MATGRSIQLTKQVGEYLVAAELGRRGYVAATFSGNVPEYDIIATNDRFRSVPVQVKAINGSSWQLDFARFAEVRMQGKRQIVGKPKRQPGPIACVMVAIDSNGTDRFYILEWRQLRDLLIRKYKANLAGKGGVRPRNPESRHTAVSEAQLERFRENWLLLDKLCASKT
jgi:hypothetical protein